MGARWLQGGLTRFRYSEDESHSECVPSNGYDENNRLCWSPLSVCVVKGDLIDLTFGIEDKDIDLGVPGQGPRAGSYKADLDASIITLTGGKTLARGDQFFVDGLVGWRRLGMAIKLEEGSRGTLFNSDMDFNDAIAAVNGEYRFGDGPWSLRYYADVGTGQSVLTWQAVAAVRYALNWGDLILNNRHLEYEVGDVGHFEALTTTFSGPSLGVNFRF